MQPRQAVRIHGFCNIMGLNERSLTPAFNYSLEKALVIELKQRKDIKSDFPCLELLGVGGAIHLFNKYLSKTH